MIHLGKQDNFDSGISIGKIGMISINDNNEIMIEVIIGIDGFLENIDMQSKHLKSVVGWILIFND